MTMKHFLLAVAAALAVQTSLFAWYYRDLLYFHRGAAAIAADAPDTFIRHADAALARETLTPKHLDTMADVARAHGLSAYEIEALRRRLKLDPADRGNRLRLADAFLRAGELQKAQQLYTDVLAASTPENR